MLYVHHGVCLTLVGWTYTRSPQSWRSCFPALSSTGVRAALATIHEHEHERVSKLANIKSQIKRNLTNEKARLRNKQVRTEVKSVIRAVREQVEAGNADEAKTALQTASRTLDKAVSKGVLHKNNAANRKSKLAKLVNGL